jgi:hypothetical protein
MCVSNENKICSLNVRIDCCNVRQGNVIPPIRPARVSRQRVARPCSRWGRSVDSGQIWIDQNRGGSIADFPACRSQIFQDDLMIFLRTRSS